MIPDRPDRPLPRLHLFAFAALVAAMFLVFPTPVGEVIALQPMVGRAALPMALPDGDWLFDVTLSRSGPGGDHLTFRAKDAVTEVSIGGRVIHSTPFRPWLHWNPARVEIPDGPADADGWRHLRVRVSARDGRGVFAIRQADGFGPLEAALALAGGLLAFALVRRWRLRASVFWVLAAGILLALAIHLATDPWNRQNDVEGHRQYAALILRDRALPPVTAGWSTWHPPLFHLLAAGAGALHRGAGDPGRAQQLVGLLAYLAGLMVAAAGLRRWPADGHAPLALALFALLPAHLFLSAKISNDVPLPLAAAALVAILPAAAGRDGLPLPATLGLVSAAAVATKISFAPIAGAAAGLLLLSDRRAGRPWRAALARALAAGLPAFAVALLWQGRTFLQTGAWLFTPAAWLPPAQKLAGGVGRFLSLDLAAAFGELRFVTYQDEVRRSWPTSAVVSSLFGEYDFTDYGRPLLAALLAAFLPVLLLAAAGALAALRRFDPRSPGGISVVLALAHGAFLLLFNLATPYASCHDARLLAPLFLPIALLATDGVRALERALPPSAARLAPMIPVPFLVLSAVFVARITVP